MFLPGPLELIIIVGFVAVVVGLVVIVAHGLRQASTDPKGNSNLRPCRDCGQYISARASKCPQCGGPVKGA